MLKRSNGGHCYGSGATLRYASTAVSENVPPTPSRSSYFAASCGMVIDFRCTGMITSDRDVTAETSFIKRPDLLFPRLDLRCLVFVRHVEIVPVRRQDEPWKTGHR